MKEQECPKCDTLILNPRWHMGVSTLTKELKKPICKDEDNNKSDKEHLHFYCKCGYDFVLNIEDKDSGIR